jgi:hypothetical protein
MSRRAVVINTQDDRKRVATWVSNVEPGTTVEFRKARRSADQNRLLWALLHDVSKQVEWYSQHLSPDDWKDVFTASLRRCRVVPGIDTGSFVPLGMRTSDMTKAEMGDLITLIQAFGAERGVVFQDTAP